MSFAAALGRTGAARIIVTSRAATVTAARPTTIAIRATRNDPILKAVPKTAPKSTKNVNVNTRAGATGVGRSSGGRK